MVWFIASLDFSVSVLSVSCFAFSLLISPLYCASSMARRFSMLSPSKSSIAFSASATSFASSCAALARALSSLLEDFDVPPPPLPDCWLSSTAVPGVLEDWLSVVGALTVSADLETSNVMCLIFALSMVLLKPSTHALAKFAPAFFRSSAPSFIAWPKLLNILLKPDFMSSHEKDTMPLIISPIPASCLPTLFTASTIRLNTSLTTSHKDLKAAPIICIALRTTRLSLYRSIK